MTQWMTSRTLEALGFEVVPYDQIEDTLDRELTPTKHFSTLLCGRIESIETPIEGEDEYLGLKLTDTSRWNY